MPRTGTRVKLAARRLKEQYLRGDSRYTRVLVDGRLAGNAFACRWGWGDRRVCWVTQLVVATAYRERGLASGLLRSLRDDGDDIYGIMSSHPAACLAAAHAFGRKCIPTAFRPILTSTGHISLVNLDFVQAHAKAIMEPSPIDYIKEAKLCGNLFNPESTSGIVSGVDTGFFVDHQEPLEALQSIPKDWWPLGDLSDGHEYLLIIEGTKRRSRSLSAGAQSN
jgi:hypothetical protein